MTNISSLGLIIFLFMALLTMALPRRFVLIPILAITCYIPLGQQVVVASLNFSMMRLIIAMGLIRVLLRSEHKNLQINKIDKLIILWVVVSITTHTLSFRTMDSFINRMGFAYNALGMYFFFRSIIYNIDDVYMSIKIIAVIIVPLTLLMALEDSTGRNIFSFFGGVPELTGIRNGKIRCQGPFSHSILAGTFGATIMPLFICLYWQENRGKILALTGFVASTLIVFFSGSSGPAMAYSAGIIGFVMWFFRNHIRTFLWGGLLSLIFLDLFVMKAHVWFLIDRFANLLGSSGHAFYRAKVIDEAVNHFSEWWLLGTTYTAHWDLTVLPAYPTQVDITNQFVRYAVDGGLFSVILFVMVIFYCFRDIGRSLNLLQDKHFEIKILLWSLGVALLTNIASFISVTYFDQMVVLWYLLLALISTVTFCLIEDRPDVKKRPLTSNGYS